MRGLEKKLHSMAQTDRQTHTHEHGDSMTNSAQWGRVGENRKKASDLYLNWGEDRVHLHYAVCTVVNSEYVSSLLVDYCRV